MSNLKPFKQELTLVVDLDERGWFKAHVENSNGRSVFQFSNERDDGSPMKESGLWLVEDGFMRHGRDTDGLLKYLRSMQIATPTATMRVEG